MFILSQVSTTSLFMQRLTTRSSCSVWPKFHYADFSVASTTSQRQTRDVPLDLSAISITFPCLVTGGRRQFPHFLNANGLVADLSQEFFKPSRVILYISRWFETPKHPRDFPVTRVAPNLTFSNSAEAEFGQISELKFG